MCNLSLGLNVLIIDAPQGNERCGCCNNRYQWTPTCNALIGNEDSAVIEAACCQRPNGTPLALPPPTPSPTTGYSPSDTHCTSKGSVSQWSVICDADFGTEDFLDGLPGPGQACGCCNGRFESTPSCNNLLTSASRSEINAACCQRGKQAPSARPSADPSSAPSALLVGESPSRSPSEMPSSSLFEELRSFIAPTNADLLKFDDIFSPQSEAYAWLQSDPITQTPGRTTRTVVERYALAVLFYSTLPWPAISGPFLSSVSVCSWVGVSCTDGLVTRLDLWSEGIFLPGTFPWELALLTDLVYLDLSGGQLTGSIPTRIIELTNLATLSIEGNSFSGPLPTALPTSLVTVYLHMNAFTGTIPSVWGTSMSNVQDLLVYENLLTGTIPSSLGQLIALTTFEFGENSLTGSVDSFLCDQKSWSTLAGDCNEVACSCCTLCFPYRGPLFEELRPKIGPTPADLVKFDDLASPQAQALAWLEADPITQTPGRTTRIAVERYALAVFYFSTSQWPANLAIPFLSSVSVCSWTGASCANGVDVTALDLYEASIFLAGTFPWELALLTNLIVLDFSFGQFTGSIPTRINELTALEILWMENNLFSGTLLPALPTSLLGLYLHHNAFTGTIPSVWGTSLPNLVDLLVYENQLVGTIPSSLGQIDTLTRFEFQVNNFIGSVDSFLCTARSWTELIGDCDEVVCTCCTQCVPTPGALFEELRADIAPTNADLLKFDDPASPQAQALAWLETDPINQTPGRSTRTVLERYVLAVFYYSTSGWPTNLPVPYLSSSTVCYWEGISCTALQNVDVLYLTPQGLTGTLPWELVLLTDLFHLILSGNGFTGSIPTRINELSNLSLLWLETNNLSGPLPTTLPASLTSIILYSNQLTGPVPSSWVTSSPNLETIDIGSNLLTGSIPTRINEFPVLETVWMNDNMLSGPLPPTLPVSLLVLQLHNNVISGPIPSTWGDSNSNLMFLAVYGNLLTGTIPSSMGQIVSLTSFSFCHNLLTGSVDSFFCSGRGWTELSGDCALELTCTCCTSCY